MNHIKEEVEDTKEIIRIRKSKKDRHRNGQKKKDNKLSTKQYTLKTQDRVARTPLKTEGLAGALEGKAVHAPRVASVVLLLLQTPL